jgi:hypothetical protein
MRRGRARSRVASVEGGLVLAASGSFAILLLLVFLIPPLARSPVPPPPHSVKEALSFLTANPCGRGVVAPARYDHVIWIWFENKHLDEVIGNADAPFFTGLAERYCGYGTAWLDNILDTDSLPNYIAATAGANCSSNTVHAREPDGDRCITENDAPAATCSDLNCEGTVSTDSIFEQLERAGKTWKAYQESMPSNCSTANPAGLYWVKHNPAPYFSRLRVPGRSGGNTCALFDIPFPTTGCDGETCEISSGHNSLADDLARGTLPTFSFVTPNNCNNMHDTCRPYRSKVKNGDDWLAAWLPRIVNGPDYRAGRTVVFLMWDEGDFAEPMPNVVVAPTVLPRTVVRATMNNFAFLRATQDMLGLPYLNCSSGRQGDGSPCPPGSTTDVRALFSV